MFRVMLILLVLLLPDFMAYSCAVSLPEQTAEVGDRSLDVSAEKRNRSEILACAKRWVEDKIPYCQCNGPKECCGDCPYCHTTRCDCSGYVSNCWGAYGGYSTRSLHEIAHPIEKDELLPGDAMLNAGVHVVYFMGWTSSEKTHYHCYQEAGCHMSLPKYASDTVEPYPFSWSAKDFLPYRYDYIVEDLDL